MLLRSRRFAEGHNLRARRIGQSPRFKQGTAECIAQCEGDPLASRAQFHSKQIQDIVAGGEIENQIRGLVLVESFANCGYRVTDFALLSYSIPILRLLPSTSISAMAS